MLDFELTLTNPDDYNKKYTISTDNKEKLWITRETGEGAEFNERDFYKLIDAFYNENF